MTHDGAMTAKDPWVPILKRPHVAVDAVALLGLSWSVLGCSPAGGTGPASLLAAGGAAAGIVSWLCGGTPRMAAPRIAWLLGAIVLLPLARSLHEASGVAILAAGIGAILTIGLPWRNRRDPAPAELWQDRAIMFVAVAGLATVACGELAHVVGRTTDFGTFIQATRALAGDGDPYTATNGGYFYPPTFAAWLRPLLWLDLPVASLAWFAFKTGLVFAALAAVFAMLEPRTLSARAQVGLAAGTLLLTARFWVTDLQFGNSNDLILALVMYAVAADLRRRPWLGGLCLAAAICIKLIPGVLVIWLLLRRRWLTLAGCGIGIVLWTAIPWLWLGANFTSAWMDYQQVGVVAKLNERLAQPDNQSMWGMIARTFPDLSVAEFRPYWAVASGVLAAVAGLVTWRTRQSRELYQSSTAGLFVLVGLLASPGSWTVHYSLTTLAFAALLRWCLERRSIPLWALFGALNLVFTVSGWWRWSVRLAIGWSMICLAGIALFVGLTAIVFRSDRGTATDLSD